MHRTLVLLGIGVALLGGAFVVAQDGAVRPQRVRFGRFATSDNCALCHSNTSTAGALRDNQGRPIAPYDLWRATMMANSARDPFFFAMMAAEVVQHPQHRAQIEAKCLRCHAPMAHDELRRRKGADAIGTGVFEQASPLAALARDGVSCTVCHQIEAKGLGEKESFSGNFSINGSREIYGPHAEVFALPMRNVLNYHPQRGDHIRDAGLCGTCHTLFVDTLDKSGKPTGLKLPEQTPYLEWRNSSFATTQTCQDCHAPPTGTSGAPVRTRIAREANGSDFAEIEARSPFGRHIFVGGNVLLPAILRDHSKELGVTAPAAAFDNVIARTKQQLQERTARLRIADIITGYEFAVDVENLTGHKFPTAHPSSRAWLRIRIYDRNRKLLFSSGEFDRRGRLIDKDGKVLASERAGGPLVAHRVSIDEPDQVQVYEAVLKSAAGKQTISAHGAAGYYKDNRLLPRGWRADHEYAAATKPIGLGEDEDDFVGGSDRVYFQVEIPDRVTVYFIEADLLYQPISERFAAELFAIDAPAIARFKRMFDAAETTPVVVAHARATVIR